MKTISQELASNLMEDIACLIYCGTDEFREEETREVFKSLCKAYGIEKVEMDNE